MRTPAGEALVCEPLRAVARHLFTTRGWALGSAASGRDAGAWQQVASALGVDASRLVRVRQVHGAAVVVERAGSSRASAPSGRALREADIILSDDPSLALAIQTADCVPLLMADRRSGAAAAAHAGWRGLASRVPSIAVQAMAAEFGSRPADLVAAIGPSISAARYEVGADVRARFESAGFPLDWLAAWFSDGVRPDHWQFDGWQSARDQLEAAGVPAAGIHSSRLCTACDGDRFCSYRRDGAGAGRMAAAIRPRGAQDFAA